MLKRPVWLLAVALAWGLYPAPILADDAEDQMLQQPAPILSSQQVQMLQQPAPILSPQQVQMLQQPAPILSSEQLDSEQLDSEQLDSEQLDSEQLDVDSPDPFADDPVVADDEPGIVADEPAVADDEPIDLGEESHGADLCDSPDCSDPTCHGCRRSSGLARSALMMPNWFLKSWIDQGFTGNVDSPVNRFNIPVTFNDRSNDYLMNQCYLAFGKHVDKCRSWDIGGRVDLLYGSDYFFTQAVGLETASDGHNPATVSNKWNGPGPRFGFGGAAIYGLAMPQAYAEVLAPLGDATTIKLGHFYTILGYESVMAPENFFYSHSYTMQYGEPKTHTGLLATTEFGPGWTFQYGFTRGWDTFEDPNQTFGFLGGITFTSRDDRTSLSVAVHTGNEDLFGKNNRTLYSLVLLHEINCRWTYVFQHDFGIEANAEIDKNFALSDAKWYGVNQYLFCRLRDNLDFGVRVEWFRDQDNARVLGFPFEPFVSGGNYVATTFGLNWRPRKNVVLRPEVRWDWSDVDPPNPSNGMFVDFTKTNQLLIGLDLIINF